MKVEDTIQSFFKQMYDLRERYYAARTKLREQPTNYGLTLEAYSVAVSLIEFYRALERAHPDSGISSDLEQLEAEVEGVRKTLVKFDALKEEKIGLLEKLVEELKKR